MIGSYADWQIAEEIIRRSARRTLTGVTARGELGENRCGGVAHAAIEVVLHPMIINFTNPTATVTNNSVN